MNYSDKTIVAFHVGRGGRFYNAGHKTFIGDKTINDIMNIKTNNLFYQNKDGKGRFCSPYYTDLNGNLMITEKDAKTGVGCLNWDNEYNTDYCQLLSDCDQEHLNLILDSNNWNSQYLIEGFFEKLNINWTKFNGDYEGLIDIYFATNNQFDIKEFLKET